VFLIAAEVNLFFFIANIFSTDLKEIFWSEIELILKGN